MTLGQTRPALRIALPISSGRQSVAAIAAATRKGHQFDGAQPQPRHLVERRFQAFGDAKAQAVSLYAKLSVLHGVKSMDRENRMRILICGGEPEQGQQGWPIAPWPALSTSQPMRPE